MTRPITIAGGGLAGLSLGISLLARGAAVTVIEAGSYPRHRVCGEFISGVSRATLDFLGIRELLDDAARHRSVAWIDRERPLLRGRLPEPALGVSRHRLDERLAARFRERGGSLVTGRRLQPSAAEGRVWAAGKRPQGGPWIGLKAHVRGLPRAADLEMHLATNGYAGLAGVEDGWTNVCGLFRTERRLRASGGGLLAGYLEAGGCRSLAAALRAAEWREGSFSATAGFRLGRQAPLAGMVRLGDSESLIPPFTGHGMSMAFQAAEELTGPLLDWCRGTTSWARTVNRCESALGRRFRRRLATAALIHPLLLSPARRDALAPLAERGLLPFRPLLALVR